MNATETHNIGNNWADALVDALDGNRPGTTARKRAEMDAWKSGHEGITWESPSWGTIKVTPANFYRLGDRDTSTSRLTMARPILLRGKEARVIPFDIEIKLPEGVKALWMQDKDVEDMTNRKDGILPRFSVNVEWNEREGYNMPHSREKWRDNFDLILIDNEGCFRVLEFSVSTRNGHFWFTIQEVFAGQVVSTTPAKASKLGVMTVEASGHTCFVSPLYQENAYPGADWLKTDVETRGKVVKYAVELDRYIPLSKCNVGRWEPIKLELPKAMKDNGWKTAAVLWYCDVLGYGFVRCQDGIPCFCHFKQILDATGKQVASKGEFPSLPPMREVAIKWAEEGGKRKATAIRVLPI